MLFNKIARLVFFLLLALGIVGTGCVRSLQVYTPPSPSEWRGVNKAGVSYNVICMVMTEAPDWQQAILSAIVTVGTSVAGGAVAGDLVSGAIKATPGALSIIDPETKNDSPELAGRVRDAVGSWRASDTLKDELQSLLPQRAPFQVVFLEGFAASKGTDKTIHVMLTLLFMGKGRPRINMTLSYMILNPRDRTPKEGEPFQVMDMGLPHKGGQYQFKSGGFSREKWLENGAQRLKSEITSGIKQLCAQMMSDMFPRE
jgi:hypothetical protein